MYITQRALTFMRALLKSYGPSNLKKRLWDTEFSGGKWDFIDNTNGDCVYPCLEKYARNGSILDLGCGPGNTANEVAMTAYSSYVGVDISEAALKKATRRSEENGRGDKNRFAQGDFISYIPTQQFDVILFRESMYHVPMGKIKSMLDRYAPYLRDQGVFMIRMETANSKLGRPQAMFDLVEAESEVVEKQKHSTTTVLVCRPKEALANATHTPR